MLKIIFLTLGQVEISPDCLHVMSSICDCIIEYFYYFLQTNRVKSLEKA